MLIRIRPVFFFVVLGLSHSACYQAPFVHLEGRRQQPAPTQGYPLEELELQALFVVPTFNDTPSPSFSPSGRMLSFRSIVPESRDSALAHAIHVLDLATGEESSALSFDPNAQPANPYYDEYGYYGGAAIGSSSYGGGYYEGYYNAPSSSPSPTASDTFSPALIDDHHGLSSGSTPYGTVMYRFTTRGERHTVLNVEGHKPRPNPKAATFLIQRHNTVAEHKLSGELLRNVPGFDPVWSPLGNRFVVHMSSSTSGIVAEWDESVALPTEPESGLVLVQDGELHQLSDIGRHPSWHPQGRQLVFELPNEEGVLGVALIDLDTMKQSWLVEDAESPSFHASGQFLAVTRAQRVLFVSLDGSERDMGIEAQSVQFSPDGRHLMVLQSAQRARATEIELAFFRLVHP